MTTRLTAACLAIFLLVVAACGSKESSGPAVVPGAPAGDVREVTGTVTAKRGDEPVRALAVGDVVSGDDVIATQPNASIVIELRHNGVRWSLAAEHTKRLGDSAAWKAPRRAGEGGATGERSTAAGRHAEREAADTAATAATTESVKATGGGSGAVGAPPDPGPDRKQAEPREPEADPSPTPKEEPKHRGDRPKGNGRIATGSDEKRGGGGDDDVKDLMQEKMKVTDAVEVTAKLGKVSTKTGKKGLSQALAAIRGCWKRAVAGGATAGGTMGLALTVGADGVVTEVVQKSDASLAPAEACIRDALAGSKFPDDAGTTITATISFGIGT